MDTTLERAALLGRLFAGPRMQWAKLRDAIVQGIRPSSEATEEDVRRGYRILEDWKSKTEGADLYTCLDKGYPRQLREVWDFPPFVFLQGDQSPLSQPGGDIGVSVVGSRRPSAGARTDALRIVRGLAHHNVTVISGLAEGIDQCAHEAALAEGIRTVGIIGTGIDQYYPSTSRHLQEAMAAGQGMVISQFRPGAGPTRASFPMRNAVMSAYGRATIIVEAAEKSGTRHQAHHAVKHGRPVILSEPVARLTSWGGELARDRSIDVHVADSPEHAVVLALKLMDRPAPDVPTLEASF